VSIRRNKFNHLANENLAPKAEVTGSNPVARANDFNGLCLFLHCQKSACPQNVRRIRIRAVPGKCGNCSVGPSTRTLIAPLLRSKANFGRFKFAKTTSEQFLTSQQYGRTSKTGSLERRMVDVNRRGFTNQFEDDSRYVEDFDHAASFVETRA
jgi:hypothetical protein